MTTFEKKKEQFRIAVDRIKSLGYEVYGSKYKYSGEIGEYAHVRSKDGNRVCYFQVATYHWYGIEFCTCHKNN